MSESEQIARLEEVINHIAAMCGNPDPAEACRLILDKIADLKNVKDKVN